MYVVKLTRQAEKAFDRLMSSQPAMGRRVASAIDRIAREPEQGVPLRGDLQGLWKYRVGSFRIIYEIFRSRLVITVIDIGDRKDIYR